MGEMVKKLVLAIQTYSPTSKLMGVSNTKSYSRTRYPRVALHGSAVSAYPGLCCMDPFGVSLQYQGLLLRAFLMPPALPVVLTSTIDASACLT